MTVQDLSSNEYNPYYQPYIDKAGKGDVLQVLKENHSSVISFINVIDDEKLNYRYEKDKWSIKEIILHLIDTERVFAYRALRISRNDKTLLPGFDQDAFVAYSHAESRSIESLLKEYESVRMATITLFESFNEKVLKNLGTASNSNLSVRAVAFIIIGHENHHLQVIKERYL